MKIMTLNTQHCCNYITKEIDYQIIADAINVFAPDIVGLNEMRSKGVNSEYEDQTYILSELTEMRYFYFAKAIDVVGDNPYGNAILSKYPIISAETIPIPDPKIKMGTMGYETRCLLKAKLEGDITILVTHFGLNCDEQKNAVDILLKNITDEKCILMGDFNVTPQDDVLNPIKARMRDAAEYFDKPLLSFPSDEPKIKIDYIFVSQDIDITAADIPAIVASDHRPHTAILSL